AFGKAGAEAIRAGADVGQVVNARRGLYTAGGRQHTREGMTARGTTGRRLGELAKQPGSRYRASQTGRPTPAQLLADAQHHRLTRAELVEALRRFGYLS